MQWRHGEGIAAGLLAVLLALLPYVSTERQVFGRWSFAFAGLLALLLLGVLVAGRLALRAPRAPAPDASPVAGLRAVWIGLDVGVALWGAGYLVGALFAPASRARLLRLEVFSSVVPAASLLEWAGAAAVIVGLLLFLWVQFGARSPALAAVACGLAAVVVLAEGGARWMAAYHPRPTALPSLADTRWHERFVDLNLAGFRDAEHAAAPRPGVRRLLVVGGAEAFGVGVDSPERRFSEALADRLARATGSEWEPINVGLRGADAEEQLAALHRGLTRRPDVVLLLASFDEPGWVGAGTPVGPTPPRARWLRVLAANSILVQELVLRLAPDPRPPVPIDPDTVRFDGFRRFVRAASGDGRIVAIVPVDVGVGSDPARRAQYRALVREADSLGLPVWGVERAFRGQREEALVVSARFPAPNALAHQLLAEEVAARLALKLDVPQVPVFMVLP